jgi:hypothetical protein
VAASLRLDVDGVPRDGNLFGKVLDTFVVAQRRAEPPVCATRRRLYHLRQQGGRRDVDVLAELAGHRAWRGPVSGVDTGPPWA